jgi:hypothetical protein
MVLILQYVCLVHIDSCLVVHNLTAVFLFPLLAMEFNFKIQLAIYLNC